MKVLYVAYRHDPRDPDAASGSDYNFYRAIKEHGFNIKLLGPFVDPPHLLERGIKRIYQMLTAKKYLKFNLSNAFWVSRTVDRVVKSWKPDVVFTIFPNVLTFYSGTVPCISRLDTTFYGQQKNYPLYGYLPLRISMWQEKKVFAKCSRIITQSEWSKNILVDVYGVKSEEVVVFPNPSALPDHIVPSKVDPVVDKVQWPPIKLLLVGRDYQRKGVDVAIETAKKLHARGLPTELTICGVRDLLTLLLSLWDPFRRKFRIN